MWNAVGALGKNAMEGLAKVQNVIAEEFEDFNEDAEEAAASETEVGITGFII
jgi:hypothetical protein